ncbi:phosphoglucosamine mutase [Euzebya tangerina]|uniref:phosphoglucosamine mutase n=1 Tax=Euzebya tangerina TaxID=591198 RepID=UPI000E31711D|nr:phosphoglucosamine mutase [Euzebya tangerina]
MGQYFGTDGVRGVANEDITPELALGIGRALVRTLREEGAPRPRVIIGRDPRASGEMLESAVVAGICSAGGDAVVLDVLPTPGVAYLTASLGATAGVMISASHNPVADNGIKLIGPTGHKLSDDEETRVEELLQRFDSDRPIGTRIGRKRHVAGAVEGYIAHLVAAAGAVDLRGVKIVLDCANGAASMVGPTVLRRLGAEVTAIAAIPDGTNINDGVGSNHPEHLQGAVVRNGADLGIAHDGDADRIVACTSDGTIVDGDAILAILAAHAKTTTGIDGVVTTVMTNLGFMHAMKDLDIPVIQTKVGDRYVLEGMHESGYVLGGEQSGHIIASEYATTGDGVLTAVLLLKAMAEQGRTLDECTTVMTRLPQVLINVTGVDKSALDDATKVWDAVKAAEVELGDSGRVLLRPSGTEPIVRVMTEAATADAARSHAETLAGVVKDVLPAG